MKKICLVLLIGLAVSTAAFAEHPEGLGLGFVSNFGFGNYWDVSLPFFWNPGLSLKAPKVPIYWGFWGNISRYGVGFGVTGDYYIFDRVIVDKEVTNKDGAYDLRLDWYLGVGLAVNMDFWDDSTIFNAGLRIPGGVSWYVIKPLEVFVGLAPTFGFYSVIDHKTAFHWKANFEIGIRYWFD